MNFDGQPNLGVAPNLGRAPWKQNTETKKENRKL